MKDLRRVVGTVVIVSFSIAALMGIAALLGGGEFGEAQTRVLLTTVVTGTESVAVLCYLAVAGHRLSWLGAVGGLVSLVAFAIAVLMTWGALDLDQGVWRTFGVALTVAASIAQVCLLLALDARRGTGAALYATCGAIAVLAVMVCVAILGDGDLGDTFWRSLGVVAILDVLGTVVVSAMGAFRRPAPAYAGLVDAATEARIKELARERRLSTNELVSEALDAYLTLR
jgi:hypothetical protein